VDVLDAVDLMDKREDRVLVLVKVMI